MHYLYRITNQLNNKVYIGQAVDPGRRWTDHKWNAKQENPIQYISRAMGKYGVENFVFELIAACRTQEDANETESYLISQYNSRDKQFGYNIKPGGNTAPHSEETKKKMSESMFVQIATKGHPAIGRVVTEEEKELHRKFCLENPMEYTPELRQKMSDAHLGHQDSEETKQKKSESIKEQWKIRGDYDSKKCEAPGCEISGKTKYKIIDGVRYCNKHGLRMLRYGRINSLDEANNLISGLLTNIVAYLQG